jgi:plasmid maintenance system antidote protein VapI
MTKRHKRTGAAMLRTWLHDQRQPQTVLAAELGISDAHLSELLREKVRPSLDLAGRIENVTGVSMGAWV